MSRYSEREYEWYEEEYSEEPEEEPLRLTELAAQGYAVDPENRLWFRLVSETPLTATRPHHGFRKGDIYLKRRFEYVDDATGRKSFRNDFLIVGRTRPEAPHVNRNYAGTPWRKVNRWWDGAILVEVLGGASVTKSLYLERNDTTAPLGEDLVERVFAMVRWGWDVGLRGVGAGPCPEPSLRGTVKSSRYGVSTFSGNTWSLDRPMQSHCNSCGASTKSNYHNPLEAFLLDMAVFGNRAHTIDNPPPPPHICNCEEERQKFASLPYPPVEEDTGWKGMSGGRCIVDYSRRVVFSKPLSDSEEEFVLRKWAIDVSPGNEPPTVRSDDRRVYVLRATHDSSD